MNRSTERWLAAGFVGVGSLLCMVLFLYAASFTYATELRSTIHWLGTTWRSLIAFLETSWLGQTHWGLVGINQLRQTNGVHMMVTLLCTIFASFLAGFLFPNTRSLLGRLFVSTWGSILTVPFSIVFLIMNLSFPQVTGVVLHFASMLWHLLIVTIDLVPGSAGIANFAETGIEGHRYVVMAMGSLLIHWALRYAWDHFAESWNKDPRHRRKIGYPP